METSKKYPRSPHLPWSPGGTSDDKRMLDVSGLLGVDLVITEKMDGSNLTYSSTGVSHSGPPTHPSFDFAKATQAQVKNQISNGLSIFCEYCYAVHSIEYGLLPSYSLIFGVREDSNQIWWSWDLVEAQAEELGIPTVPVLFRGIVGSSKDLQTLTEKLGNQPSFFGGIREGVVVRTSRGYSESDFSTSLAKWVRKDHVQTDEHWKDSEIRPQRIAR
jgi:hypothetical protein